MSSGSDGASKAGCAGRGRFRLGELSPPVAAGTATRASQFLHLTARPAALSDTANTALHALQRTLIGIVFYFFRAGQFYSRDFRHDGIENTFNYGQAIITSIDYRIHYRIARTGGLQKKKRVLPGHFRHHRIKTRIISLNFQSERAMTIIIRCFECEKRYRVAGERAGKRVKCKNCGTMLQIPNTDVDQPTLEDGTAIYCHEYRDRDFEPANGNEDNIAAVSDRIERYIGPVEMVFHEVVSDLVHIDIQWVKPSVARPRHTLITSGMSHLPMTVPDACSEFQYGELSIKLSPDWRISEKAFKSENNYWPVRLLKTLARLPHEFETWLGTGHTVPNGGSGRIICRQYRIFVCVAAATRSSYDC